MLKTTRFRFSLDVENSNATPTLSWQAQTVFKGTLERRSQVPFLSCAAGGVIRADMRGQSRNVNTSCDAALVAQIGARDELWASGRQLVAVFPRTDS